MAHRIIAIQAAHQRITLELARIETLRRHFAVAFAALDRAQDDLRLAIGQPSCESVQDVPVDIVDGGVGGVDPDIEAA